jgi:hypothetical protein
VAQTGKIFLVPTTGSNPTLAWNVDSLGERSSNPQSVVLGKHHDMVLLEHALSPMNTDKRNAVILKSLRQSIRVRKLQLEKRCLVLGAKLYAEDSVSVREKLKTYWA